MAVKLLADENVAASVVKTLRSKGYNVKDLKETGLFGIADSQVLETAR